VTSVEVATLDDRFAGMQPDLHLDRHFSVLISLHECTLDVDRALDGVDRTLERDHERVADRLHLVA
jgi:hypothetical protein